MLFSGVEGGRWNKQEARLDESEPKKLFVQLPAIFVTAMTAKDLKALLESSGLISITTSRS